MARYIFVLLKKSADLYTNTKSRTSGQRSGIVAHFLLPHELTHSSYFTWLTLPPYQIILRFICKWIEQFIDHFKIKKMSLNWKVGALNRASVFRYLDRKWWMPPLVLLTFMELLTMSSDTIYMRWLKLKTLVRSAQYRLTVVVTKRKSHGHWQQRPRDCHSFKCWQKCLRRQSGRYPAGNLELFLHND